MKSVSKEQLHKAMAVLVFKPTPSADPEGLKTALDADPNLISRGPDAWGPSGSTYRGHIKVKKEGILVTGWDLHITPGPGGTVTDTKTLGELRELFIKFGYEEK